MGPFLLNETAPIEFALHVLMLLGAAPLYIWLMVSLLSNRPKARDRAMVMAAGLAIVGWLGSLAGLFGGGVSLLLFIPAVVCFFRLRSLYKQPPTS
jgi:hypothetical protein